MYWEGILPGPIECRGLQYRRVKHISIYHHIWEVRYRSIVQYRYHVYIKLSVVFELQLCGYSEYIGALIILEGSAPHLSAPLHLYNTYTGTYTHIIQILTVVKAQAGKKYSCHDCSRNRRLASRGNLGGLIIGPLESPRTSQQYCRREGLGVRRLGLKYAMILN